MAEFNDIENNQVNEVETEKDFSPVYSYTQKVNSLISAGKITAPKYRTLSQEQMASYLKAKDMPEYDRKVAMSALKKADENTFYENASNAAVIEAMDILSGDKTRLAIGNMLVSGDYTPLIETGATLVGYKAGEEAAKAAGRGWVAQTGAGIVGATAAGAIVGALTPTATASQAEESAILEKYMTPEQKAEREKQYEEFYEQQAVAQLKKAGYTDEQIEKLRKEPAVQSFGRAIMQSAMEDIEYKAAIAPKVDEGSIAATIVGGAASFGELALVGAGTKIAASKIAKSVKMPTDRFGRKAAEFTRKKGTSYDEVVDRYAGMVGTKAGTAAATTEMSSEIMGQGALESVRKYIEETGDTKLEHYQGDLKNVALDAYNTHIQNIIEYKLGVGKFIRNPRLATKYGEWLNGFAQEFSQGEINDIAEWLKGNKTAMDILRNIPQNMVEGVVGAVLQGGVGTGIYTYYHNQNVNDLTGVVMSQSTAETPIDEKKAREFAERKVIELEEGIANDVAQDIIQFTGATQYQGQIYNTIRDNVKKAIDYQREQMKETLEGSKYDDMTEDELAQHIEAVAQDETDRTVIESLENGTPLSESPRLKGETIDGTYYLEGSDYAKQTAEKAQQERAIIRKAVYASQDSEKSAQEVKKVVKETIKEELQKVRKKPVGYVKQPKTIKQLFGRSINLQFARDSGILQAFGFDESSPVSRIHFKTTGGISDWNDIVQVLSQEGIMQEYSDTYEGQGALEDYAKKLLLETPTTNLYELRTGVKSDEKFIKKDQELLEKAQEAQMDGLLKANGYTDEQLKDMSWQDKSDVLAELYRQQNQVQEPEMSEEDLAEIPDDILWQETFDIADENAILDEKYPAYEGDTIEVDGKERSVYNSNGDRIAKSKEALTNFWRWFGDSKVVDEQGRPLVVYHGTHTIFDTFDKTKLKSGTGENVLGEGFYFTNNLDLAERYAYGITKAGRGLNENNVMSVYLKIENPATSAKTLTEDNNGIIEKQTGKLESLGTIYVVFEPNQIKSVDNRGTFSADTGNIYFQDRQRGKGGAYDARNRSITLGSGANITTLPHELAHYWIDKNFKWARSGKASTAWMQQWQAVEKWLGIDPEDKYLTSEASEKFARAYERFLAEEELPLVLKKSMADFRDFVLDHYDYELDDAKGLQDRLGRPIKLNEDVKEWFRKSIYDSYMSASDMEVVNERLAQADREVKETQPAIDQSKELETAAQNSVEINEVAPTGMEIQTSAGVSNDVIVGKRTIGGGEEKESKGVIRQELGGTYESTSWDIQEQMVSDYLESVSIDEAIEALDNDTYPDKIDPNFLRQALVEKLLDEGREIEATALIEETADDFTEAAQKLQAARRINTPFTNAIRMLTIGKAEKLAQARYGKNKDAIKSLDSAMNALVAKYEKDFMNAQTDEERELVYATMQDEAIRTIGTLEKDKTGGLDFQDIEDKEERKEANALRKRQNRRASIKAYRSRAKRALKQALGLEPSREQVRQIKKLSVKVAREIKDFRNAVKENKTSAIDPTKILEAQNELNEYMNQQLPPRVLSTAADAVNSYMMANMLWNPATNVFNLESTWVQMIPHIMATYINYGKGTISWKEKANLIKQALALQAKTGYNIFSLQDFFDKKTIWAEKFYEPTSMAGKAIRFPLTMLGLADTMNKGIVFLNHVDSMATSQAKEEGKKNGWNKEQITQRAKELFYQALNTDPRTITRDGLKIRQSAVREGEEATFTQNSQTAQFVNKFRKMLNLGAKTGLGNVIMPFTTTIANIAEDTVLNYALGSVRNIPLNLIPAIATQFDKTATAEMKKEAWKKLTPETKNVIKNMIGILMILSLALSDPDDDSYVLGYDRQTEVDKDIRQNRNAPSGYAVRIGDKWVDLDLFGIGSPWARAYLIAKRNDFSTNGWVKGVASVIDLVPGVSEIEDIYKKLETTIKYKGESEAVMEFAGGKVEDIAERLIPAQALFNQIGNITDTTKRMGFGGVKERVLSKLPLARETLEERTSKQTGEPITQTDTLANLITGQRIKDYVESTPADRARYELAKAGEALNYQEGRSKLSALGKESKEYKKAVQRVRRDFTKKLNSAVQTTEYQRLDIDQKKKLADKLHKEALDKVKASYGLRDKKSVEKKKKTK